MADRRRIRYAGKILSFPADWTNEEINGALANWRKTVHFEALIDKETGASTSVRKAVGDAQSRSEDRLSTLRKFYPDAVPHGENNFVFTHPETGRPTLYNETEGGLFDTGLTIGDAASLTRKGVVTVGSTLGGMYGAGVGAVAGAPTGPGALATTVSGAVVGAGVGAGATGAFYDFLSAQVGTDDTRSLGRRLFDTTMETLSSAASKQVNESIFRGALKNILGANSVRSLRILTAMDDFGVQSSAGTVAQGPEDGRLEAASDKAASSAPARRAQAEQAERIVQQSQAAAARLADRLGTSQTPQGAGEAIRHAADSAPGRFKTAQNALETRLTPILGEDRSIATTHIAALRVELLETAAKAPESLGPELKPAIDLIRRLEAEAAAAGGGLPYRAFRAVRTNLGRKAADVQEGAINRVNLDRIYGAMTLDLEDTVAAIGGAARDAVRETPKRTADFKAHNDRLFVKLIETDAPEKAYRFAMKSAKDGGAVLTKLRDRFTAAEWSTVSATVLHKMGSKGFGNAADDAFRLQTFIRNYDTRLSDEAKQALFGTGGLRPELDALVGTFRTMREKVRRNDFSNPAGAMHFLDTLSALGYGAVGLGAGGGNPALAVTAVGGAVMGKVVLPHRAAKLLTNPAFVRWLATPVDNVKAIGAHVGKLYVVSQQNPEISEEIREFVDAMRANVQFKSVPGQKGN